MGRTTLKKSTLSRAKLESRVQDSQVKKQATDKLNNKTYGPMVEECRAYFYNNMIMIVESFDREAFFKQMEQMFEQHTTAALPLSDFYLVLFEAPPFGGIYPRTRTNYIRHHLFKETSPVPEFYNLLNEQYSTLVEMTGSKSCLDYVRLKLGFDFEEKLVSLFMHELIDVWNESYPDLQLHLKEDKLCNRGFAIN